jgi:membrane-bound ClpP family serine protease
MRRLNPLGVAGTVLLVLGLAALTYQGITYTSRETVVDLGPIHATAERQRTVPLPPIFGIAAVAAGVVLLVTGVRRPAT